MKICKCEEDKWRIEHNAKQSKVNLIEKVNATEESQTKTIPPKLKGEIDTTKLQKGETRTKHREDT